MPNKTGQTAGSDHRLLTLGVLASGRGTNLQAILDAIASGRLKAKVAVVISDQPTAYALERAKRHGIAAVALDPHDYPDREAPNREAYDRTILAVLKQHGVELVVMAGYLRIATRVMIEAYPNRMMNIHPSLLPAFPGLHAVRQALARGLKVTGCTVHFTVEQVDSGPIIIQAAVPVEPDDTEETLTARIQNEEHRIYPLAIQWFAEGRLRVEGLRVIVTPPTHTGG